MSARYVLGTLSVVFLLLSVIRIAKDSGLTPASRTWLTIAVIFAAVSAWSFYIARRGG